MAAPVVETGDAPEAALEALPPGGGRRGAPSTSSCAVPSAPLLARPQGRPAPRTARRWCCWRRGTSSARAGARRCSEHGAEDILLEPYVPAAEVSARVRAVGRTPATCRRRSSTRARAVRDAALRGSPDRGLQPALPAAPARPPGRHACRHEHDLCPRGHARRRPLQGDQRRLGARGGGRGAGRRRRRRAGGGCAPRTTSGASAATSSSRCCPTPSDEAAATGRGPALERRRGAPGLSATISVGWATWAGEDAEAPPPSAPPTPRSTTRRRPGATGCAARAERPARACYAAPSLMTMTAEDKAASSSSSASASDEHDTGAVRGADRDAHVAHQPPHGAPPRRTGTTTIPRRGLLMLVGRRRRFLNYLQKKDLEGYRSLIRELGLRR